MIKSLLPHPAHAQKNTALARPQPHKPYASSVFYGIAAVCNCHTFCVVFCQRSTAHCNPRSCGCKELSPNAEKTKQKDTSLQPPPPFRLCQYANRRKLSYIMWHYRFASHSLFPCLCKHPTAQAVL